MVDHPRQESDLRSQWKCSKCREKKIKCTPSDRQWEENHQKCDNCQKHDDYPCGPNLNAKQDAVSSRSRYNLPTRGDDSIRDPGDEPRTPATQRTGTHHGELYVGGGIEKQPSMVVGTSNNPRKRKIASTEKSKETKEPKDLVNEADRLLGDLNSAGRSYEFSSHLTPIYCRDPKSSKMFNKEPNHKISTISHDFHQLFKHICTLGHQLHERGKTSDAERVFLKLYGTLQQSSGLGAGSDTDALWKIANFFWDIGDKDECEWVLIKIAETHTSIVQRDLNKMLASSLVETSKRADHYLLNLSKKYLLSGESSLALPPIQRLAQLRGTNVGSILPHLPNSVERSPPALANLEAIHIAAAQGEEESLRAYLEASAPVDAVDFHNHTALFLAAVKGHDGCCEQLIRHGANPNSRNRHGTTILEAAAGTGHIEIVKRLVRAGAELNTDLMCCSSSPLQAAIENVKSPLELGMYLSDGKADLRVRRRDGKNAMDLADNKCTPLASFMRQIQMQGPQDLFD